MSSFMTLLQEGTPWWRLFQEQPIDLLMADDACAAVNSGTSDGILGRKDDEMSLFY